MINILIDVFFPDMGICDENPNAKTVNCKRISINHNNSIANGSYNHTNNLRSKQRLTSATISHYSPTILCYTKA